MPGIVPELFSSVSCALGPKMSSVFNGDLFGLNQSNLSELMGGDVRDFASAASGGISAVSPYCGSNNGATGNTSNNCSIIGLEGLDLTPEQLVQMQELCQPAPQQNYGYRRPYYMPQNNGDLQGFQWMQGGIHVPLDSVSAGGMGSQLGGALAMGNVLQAAGYYPSMNPSQGIQPSPVQLVPNSHLYNTRAWPGDLNSLIASTPRSPSDDLRKKSSNGDEKSYPKPVFSYSCLIAMALKESDSGSLPVSEIYKYMQAKFPYFRSAPDGWKKDGTTNSVRHNLSLNKAFCKLERQDGLSQRKGCLWSLKPEKQESIEREIRKWKKKHPEAIRASMANPDELEISSDSLDDSTEEQSVNTPEHIVPEVKAITPPNGEDLSSLQDDTKDLFDTELFQDLPSPHFWGDILSHMGEQGMDMPSMSGQESRGGGPAAAILGQNLDCPNMMEM